MQGIPTDKEFKMIVISKIKPSLTAKKIASVKYFCDQYELDTHANKRLYISYYICNEFLRIHKDVTGDVSSADYDLCLAREFGICIFESDTVHEKQANEERLMFIDFIRRACVGEYFWEI